MEALKGRDLWPKEQKRLAKTPLGAQETKACIGHFAYPLRTH